MPLEMDFSKKVPHPMYIYTEMYCIGIARKKEYILHLRAGTISKLIVHYNTSKIIFPLPKLRLYLDR